MIKVSLEGLFLLKLKDDEDINHGNPEITNVVLYKIKIN